MMNIKEQQSYISSRFLQLSLYKLSRALQKETEAFERNRYNETLWKSIKLIIRPNYDKRNESFREEVQGVMERFKVGYD